MKPTNTHELELCINSLVEYHQHLTGPIHHDRKVKYFISRMSNVFVIIFKYTDKSGIEQTLNYHWLPYQSLLELVRNIDEALNKISA